jgi:hypothetical protein
MTKTPEELAQEYVIGKFPDTNSDMFLAAESVHKAFFAGYKAAQQWISVSDRLPEENQEVLISYGQKPFFLIAFLYYPNHPKKDVKMFCGNNNTNYSLDYVTHWQPLSAPPKEEK